ncbi:MAG TPA: hypothetical protein VFV38_16385 [Ktedonobacteraceae bacterium]|nr:hypothetical protein [Ktedonobacteraceae bacterium]
MAVFLRRLLLLPEGKARIGHDDPDDDCGQQSGSGNQREGCRSPQQGRQQLGKLPNQFSEPGLAPRIGAVRWSRRPRDDALSPGSSTHEAWSSNHKKQAERFMHRL